MGLASGVYLTAANTLVSELYPERPGRASGNMGSLPSSPPSARRR